MYYVTEDEVLLGNYHIEQAMEQYAKCLKGGSWPAYEDKFIALGLPPWAMKELQEG